MYTGEQFRWNRLFECYEITFDLDLEDVGLLTVES
jgi:hypothetical protein